MVEFKWIIMSLFLILLLQFGAVTGQDHYIIARDEDSVTLPCKGQDRCNSFGTTWLYSQIENSPVVALIELGQIGANAKAKSDRLSVTADCSLVIKKVTVEDFGRYTCRQFNRSGQQQGRDSRVRLSVINIHEHNDADKVTLSCSVLKYGQCQHTVDWLYEGITDKLDKTTGSCFAKVTFKTSSVDKKLFKCKLTERNGETRLCNFIPRTSCEKQGKSADTENTTRVDNNNNDTSANKGNDQHHHEHQVKPEWWWFLLVAVGLLILLIIVVVVVRRRRKPKGKKTKMDDGTVDAGDVSYASVSYIKKNDSKPRVQTHDDDDDEGDAVTYSTVKISSSSAGASTDPNTVYATVNKPSQ